MTTGWKVAIAGGVIVGGYFLIRAVNQSASGVSSIGKLADSITGFIDAGKDALGGLVNIAGGSPGDDAGLTTVNPNPWSQYGSGHDSLVGVY